MSHRRAFVFKMQDLFLERTPLGQHLERYGFVGSSASSGGNSGKASATVVQKSVGKQTCVSQAEIKTHDQASGQDMSSSVSSSVHIEKYKSKDSETGRVWGMPSAFGRGQCLDCPAQALPPHKRCEACQKIEQSRSYPCMAEDDLRDLMDAFQALRSGPVSDAWPQVQELCSLLRGGKISEPVQVSLRGVAKAVSEDRRSDAEVLLSSLAREDWNQRKRWLRALQRLVRTMKPVKR